MPRHLHLDPFAGIAGDMFIGALIDLGAPLAALEDALRPLPIALPYRLAAEPTTRHAIRGIDFKVLCDVSMSDVGCRMSDVKNFTPAASHSHPTSHIRHPTSPHPHTGPNDLFAMIDALTGPPRLRDRARCIVSLLADAEAKVHGIPVDQVHFHEVGAVDSIIDMLGVAVLLEQLDIDTLSSASLPIGHGLVKCAHGLMPLPAPATAELLVGVPHHGVDRKGETVTPTGAALVKALCQTFGPMPPMQVEKIGYGAGDRDDPDMPNLLRVFMGGL
ncbi:MAG: nickel pincer cofactor biosynthesis protein LarC [Phycisphaerales bacterium]